jgi:hypothetical protein
MGRNQYGRNNFRVTVGQAGGRQTYYGKQTKLLSKLSAVSWGSGILKTLFQNRSPLRPKAGLSKLGKKLII